MTDTYSFHEFHIPPHMMDGLTRYIEHGIAPGGFLTAVLENNLREACARADDINIRNLPAYIAYLYNDAPSACWGSPEKVDAWVANFRDPRDGSAA